VWFAEACKLEKRPHLEEIIDSSEDEPTAKRVRRSIKSSRTSRLEEEKNSLELTAIKNIRIPGSDDRITRLSFENKEQNPGKQQPQDQRKEGPQPPLVPTNRAFESKMAHAPDWDGNQYTGTAKDQSIPVDVELDYIPGGERRPGRPPEDPVAYFSARAAILRWPKDLI
jgi:hypothetical protein